MARRRSVEDWRQAVFRARTINGNVQVLLLLLADRMRADRKVSVPRPELAAALGVHEQRIADRIKAARDAGYLDTVRPGYRGHTAEYQGMFPDDREAESIRILSTHSNPEIRMHSQPECIPDGEYATSRQPPNRAGLNTGADGDVQRRSNERSSA